MNRGRVSDLTGRWHLTPVDRELRRTGADLELDHDGWPQVAVPGHWADSPELRDLDGPMLYRHRFGTGDLDRPGDEIRYWLRFDGVMSGAEVWLDGGYLGDTVGYFAPHRFDISAQVAARDEHVVAVDVACPPGGGPRAADRNNVSLTGALQTGVLAPPGNPGGIWRPVSVTATGPVAIQHGRVLCPQADDDHATLQIRIVLDSSSTTDVDVTTEIVRGGATAATTTTSHSLAAGENRLEWEVRIDEPELWWPYALGDQPLYDILVTVVHQGTESDRRHWQTGLRQVEMSNFTWRINGERLYLKGIAYGPAGPLLNEVASGRLIGDVELVREAGLDLMRVYAHVTRPEVYQAADRLGVLIWQDLPLIGGYSSKIRRRIKTVIREAVDHLGPHPSVIAWGGHVLPNGDAVELPTGNSQDRPQAILRRFARHITPSWNRVVLDSIIGRELNSADGSRPVITRSASLPSPTDPGGSDAFLWFGWRAGLAGDFADAIRRWPRLGAFPGGVGSQSVVVDDWPIESPGWETAEKPSFDRYLPRRAYSEGSTWARATQAYQADVLETHIHILRRLKYRPTGGFCLFALADAEPSGGFGIVDHERRPKSAWPRVVAACRPIIIVVETLPATVVPHQSIRLAVHAISDLRHRCEGAVVEAVVRHGGAQDVGPDPAVDGLSPGDLVLHQRWRGDLAPDSCQRVAELSFVVPDRIGPLTVAVALEVDDGGRPRAASSRFQPVVIPEVEGGR